MNLTRLKIKNYHTDGYYANYNERRLKGSSAWLVKEECNIHLIFPMAEHNCDEDITFRLHLFKPFLLFDPFYYTRS